MNHVSHDYESDPNDNAEAFFELRERALEKSKFCQERPSHPPPRVNFPSLTLYLAG